jgi:ubiquitin-activating enzyme E1
MKGVGRGRPICSWFHYDFMEVYKGDMDMDVGMSMDKGARERDYLVVFGKEGYERIKKARFVLEGAGTVGCEFLKVAALMGLAT